MNKLPFSQQEFEDRIARVQHELVHRDIDLLVVSSPENMFYLCGYSAMSYYTPQALLVGQQGTPVWFGRAMDRACAVRTTCLPEDDLVGYDEALVDRTDRHPVSALVEVLKWRAMPTRRVGIEFDSYWISPRAASMLTAAVLPGEAVDAALLVDWQRAVKSPAEIAFMREAARVADSAMQTAFDAIRPGVRECDAMAEIVAAQIRGDASCGGMLLSEPVYMVIGDKTDCPHLSWSDAVIPAGVSVNLELAGARHHYHAAMARTLSLGPPAPELQSLMQINLDALAQAQQAMTPGRTAADVARCYFGHLARHGIAKDSRAGYAIGIGVNPTWTERTISIRADDTTELRSGMTFHLLGGLWSQPHACTASDTVLVAPAGGQALSAIDRRLHVRY